MTDLSSSAIDQLTVVDHPILKRDLTTLRRKETPYYIFRRVLKDATAILAYEAMRDLPVREIPIETPLEPTNGYQLIDEIVVVPILRAGLGMVDGFTRYVPEARVGHVGLYRDEMSFSPVDYYSNLPQGMRDARIFIVDPMLATGHSAARAIEHLKEVGAQNIRFVCFIATPEGVQILTEHYPEISVVAAALDEELDENAFIRPGLGDAGDRIFGTDPA